MAKKSIVIDTSVGDKYTLSSVDGTITLEVNSMTYQLNPDDARDLGRELIEYGHEVRTRENRK